MTAPSVTVLTDGSVYGVPVSSIQSDVEITTGDIADYKFTGTSKSLTGSNPITDVWGEGNFIAVTFTASDWTAYDSVKVGLEPSEGSGMQELIGHLDDLDSVFKITDKTNQRFKVIAKKGSDTTTVTYYLGDLTCQS